MFALSIVRLAGATWHLSGWLTLLGGGMLIAASLVETVVYIGALFPSPTADSTTMAQISMALGHAVQHLFFIASAPALFLPLGAVILGSRVVSRVFGYLAIALGAVFAVAGMATMATLIVPGGVTALAAVLPLWWLAVAIALIIRRGQTTLTLVEARASRAGVGRLTPRGALLAYRCRGRRLLLGAHSRSSGCGWQRARNAPRCRSRLARRERG